jgi:hypothetical protein
MSSPVEAEYLEKERVLKLARPLEGVRDHERVSVVVETSTAAAGGEWPALSDEAGDDLARAVRDAFGRDDIAV